MENKDKPLALPSTITGVGKECLRTEKNRI